MRVFIGLKNSAYLCSALLLLAACQPSPPTDEPVTAENSETVETPIIIDDDSVTMTPDHILSIKPSRYQPSIGLQGRIEPIKKTQFTAAKALTVQQVLVEENQWVEKGTPLLIVQRQEAASKPTESATTSTAENTEFATSEQSTQNSKTQNKTDNPNRTTKPTPTSRKANENNAEAPQSSGDKTSADKNNVIARKNAPASTKPSYKLMTVRASFSGRVEKLYAEAEQKVDARQPLLQLSDETELHFIGIVPIQAEPQLSVGQTVNFTAEGMSDKFTGQVSRLTATVQPKQLLVHVNVVNNEISREKLQPDMQVTGRVNYGQIDVGTIVPERALHDVDLTELQRPPYKPLRPLSANVWIIKQDQRLTRQPVEVVEYDPITKQYLIAGISNDSLICLADLTIESKGKKVVVS
ncbi:efflux RND transporter periplasmic adaptor subunit [Psychrobacter sp. K31L]|uniref:efflux RND transporter periplasmic adaptor subunit n=1 Tax=Psychrobacter sp. K31L TaxID=2820758 RepID=UPI001B32712E|nr:HlyD family efflux transporter periplasmic adaptor subunit [Psychrobacter sp. K31L]MBP3945604.1 HlyD family efflux transporter periplasmic adaptor subunit [Psychrobacter sp. K31L]